MSEVKIDWSKCPIGTTHAVIDGDRVCWRWLRSNSKWSYWSNRSNKWISAPAGFVEDESRFVPRGLNELNCRIENTPQGMNTPGYEQLADVLQRAYDQAAKGKGAERHAGDLPFHEQPMQQIGDLVGQGFMLGQAIKKLQESQRLPHDRAIAERLGAINYIVGSIIWMERQPVNVGLPEGMELDVQAFLGNQPAGKVSGLNHE